MVLSYNGTFTGDARFYEASEIFESGFPRFEKRKKDRYDIKCECIILHIFFLSNINCAI